jgi:ATP-dependent RNA helicase DeaD
MAALCTLLHSTAGESSLIFGRTKYGVEKLGNQLSKLGFTVGTLHGNKSQRAREEVLKAFRLGQVQTLLATNVAARGLDITGIDQVINYELPESSDLFTHRIGRTGRMGRQGKAITLLVPSDVPKWRRMARSLGQAGALQRLAIDEEAIGTIPLASPEASVTQEHEQNGEQQQVHDRKPFSPSQEHGRRARPKHESHTASSSNRRQKESVTSATPTRTPVWQPEGFTLPEHPYSGKARDGRRGAGKQSSFGRTTGKHKAHAFAATEPQHRTARRKPRATPGAQARRSAASKRSASR